MIVFTVTMIAALLVLSLLPNSLNARIDLNPTLNLRVINGTVVYGQIFNSVVSLIHHTRYSSVHICGGTLLNQDTVLTAAHCFWKRNFRHPYSWSIIAGTHSLRFFPFQGELADVDDIIFYRNKGIYSQQLFRSLLSTYGDFAILKLSTKLRESRRIKYARLSTSEHPERLKSVRKCYIVGWGRTGHSRRPSPVLLQGEMRLLPTNLCRRRIRMFGNHYERVPPFTLCAESGHLTTSACHGDSGGPLFCEFESANNRTEMLQVGVASRLVTAGICGVPHAPVLFERVSWVQDWISEIAHGDGVN